MTTASQSKGRNHLKPEISVIAMKTPIEYLRRRFGQEALDRFLDEVGVEQSYLDDHNNWLSFEFSHRLFRRLVELSGDEKICIEVGQQIYTRETLGTTVWIALKALGTPAVVYRKIFELAQIYNRVGRYEVRSLTRNRLVLEYRPGEGYQETDKCFCHYRIGNFTAVPMIWNLPPASCREMSCIVDGAETCTYEFTWQEKRSHLYPLAGMSVAAVFVFLFSMAFPATSEVSFWTTNLLLLLAGFQGGRLAALRKTLRRNKEISKEQSDALEASFANLSDKYVELQASNKALEEAHRELTLHKEHLEELVRERTRELEESKAQLEESYEKLQALDRMKMSFFNNISHELRTPLALTLGPVEAMLQGEMGPLQEKQKAYLSNVYTNSLRLLKLINNLLDLAKLEEGGIALQYGKYELGGFVRGVVESFEAAARKRRVKIETAGDSPSLEVYFDRERLEKVLINLLGNALKFTPPGGSILVHWREEGEFVRISVEDTGPGIPEEALGRIFDRFVQADDSASRKHGGTGIGLSLAKEITELHGGTIRAANRPAGGAVFSFTLPLAEREIAEPPGVSEDQGWTKTLYREADYVDEVDRGAPSETAPGGTEAEGEREETHPDDRPTVLVVEDNTDMRGFLADCLSSAFRVVTAVDGEDGWRRIREARPDLVVSDIMMPNRNGYELCAAAKNDPALQHTPFLLLSSKSEVEMKVEGFEQGADDYLTKPFNPRELIARVKNLIRVRSLEREVQARNRQLAKSLEELKEDQAQLIHSEKMASVGLLSAGLVHEINNPLNAAISSIRTLSRSLDRLQAGEGSPEELGEKLTRSCRRALHGLKRCEEIITGLRQFSRKDVEGKKEEDIHVGLESTISLLPRDQTKKIAIHRDYRLKEKVYCNLGQLNQVFMNLLTNALHAIPEEGEIRIRTEREGEEALIRIEDTGVGIPREILSHIFEPFYTTKEVGKGTGLGLSISHQVIENHGGRLEVESTEARGSTFTVRLPLRKPARAPKAEDAPGTLGAR